MAITVVAPEGGFIGPGMQVNVVSTAFGPFPPGATLSINVFQTGGETLCGKWSFPINTNVVFPVLDLDSLNPGPYRAIVPEGGNVTLTTTITSDLGVFDTGTTTGLTWHTEGQIQNLLKELNEAVTTGGFSTEDRATLVASNEAVTMSFPGLPAFPLSSLLQLFGPLAKPPVGFLTRELIGDYSGNVTFTRPSGPVGVDAFGLTWEVLTYGGGIGLDTGVPVRFETRLLDVQVQHTDHDGHLFVSHADEFDFSNWYLFFDPAFPTQVDVAIGPSVEIRFYWLLATL